MTCWNSCGSAYPNIADVEFAIFETNGEITVIPKSQCRPLQPRDLNSYQLRRAPHPLVVDGNINYENLGKVKLDELWLKDRLRQFDHRCEGGPLRQPRYGGAPLLPAQGDKKS